MFGFLQLLAHQCREYDASKLLHMFYYARLAAVSKKLILQAFELDALCWLKRLTKKMPSGCHGYFKNIP